MSRKRLTTWVLLVAVGMTTRIAVAAPRAAMTELRAIVCCAAHCAKLPRPPATPRRCCFVDAGANDPASAATSASLERPALMPTALFAVTPALAPGHATVARIAGVARRAGPAAHRDTVQLRC